MVDLFIDHRSRLGGVTPVALGEHSHIPAFLHLLFLFLCGSGKIKFFAEPKPSLVVHSLEEGDIGRNAGVESEVGDTGYTDVGARGVAFVQVGLGSGRQRQKG